MISQRAYLKFVVSELIEPSIKGFTQMSSNVYAELVTFCDYAFKVH